MRRILLVIGGWLLAAAAAAAVGLLAVSLLGSGITAERVQPLSQQQAASALAHAGPTGTPRAGPTTTPTTTVRSVTRPLHSPGGSVIARCTGSTVYLLSWTPGQGFESDDEIQGPARTAYVKFESDHLDVYLTITCRNGTPVATAATDPDD